MQRPLAEVLFDIQKSSAGLIAYLAELGDRLDPESRAWVEVISIYDLALDVDADIRALPESIEDEDEDFRRSRQ